MDKLQQAIALIKSGDANGGKNLLIDIVNSDPTNEVAWLSLASVVSRDKRLFCLEKAFNINPNNMQTKNELEKLKTNGASEQYQPKVGNSIEPRGNTDARLSGLFLFLIGAGASYWQILMPIMKALRYESNVNYSEEIVVIAPLAMFMGLFLLIFGAKGLKSFSSIRPTTLNMILILSFTLIYFLGCILGMGYVMKTLGYY